MNRRSPPEPTRRAWLKDTGLLVCVAAMPLPLSATPAEVASVMREAFGNAEIQLGRVTLQLPALAENGIDVSAQMADAGQIEVAGVGMDTVLPVGIFPENVYLIVSIIVLSTIEGLE